MNKTAQHRHKDSRPTVARAFNAVISVALIVYLLVHIVLGTAFWYGIVGNDLSSAAWIGVCLVAIHAVVSLVTTVSLLSKKHHDASHEEKVDQLLMWITGVLAVVLLVLHLTVGSLVGVLYFTRGALIAIGLLVLLGIHIYIGTKSLTRDLQLSPTIRKPFRIGVIFFCAFMTTVFFLVSL